MADPDVEAPLAEPDGLVGPDGAAPLRDAGGELCALLEDEDPPLAAGEPELPAFVSDAVEDGAVLDGGP